MNIDRFRKWIQNDRNRKTFTDTAEKILTDTAQMPFDLERYRTILKSIRWEIPGIPCGVSLPVSAWRSSQRLQLVNMLLDRVLGRLPSGDFIPKNILSDSLGDDDYPTTVLNRRDAWRIFLTHVANSLYMEISGLLHWSMQLYSPDELKLLLDSRSYFLWDSGYQGYRLTPDLTGHVTPTDARCLFRFIKTIGPRGLVAPSTVDTIGNVLEWCRHHLIHFTGAFKTGNVDSIWQYRGYPPIMRMKRMDPHYTAGCWGTTGFIQAVLRIVNIPVESFMLGWISSAHDTCHFTRQERYLSHGDDCYNLLAFSTPPFPARELMIDQEVYDSWFKYPDVPADTCQNNIGRQVVELGLKYLSDFVLYCYCEDQRNNTPPQSGKVMELFGRYYAFQELWDSGLWDRLQAKVASFGGCANIPSSYDSAARPQLPWVP